MIARTDVSLIASFKSFPNVLAARDQDPAS
jgi:hypothetical protein